VAIGSRWGKGARDDDGCARARVAPKPTLAAILIERETIDKDQFERLLAGEDEAEIFVEEPAVEPEAPAEEPKKRPEPRPKPFPIPGATMQAPPPEPSQP